MAVIAADAAAAAGGAGAAGEAAAAAGGGEYAGVASMIEGGTGILGGFVQSFTSMWQYNQQKMAQRSADKYKAALYERQRSDFLKQQAIDNLFNREQIAQNEAAFNFGKQRWGEEFGFTKRQYRDRQKQIKEAMRAQGLTDIQSQIGRAMAEDSNLKDVILTRFGV